MTRFAFLLVILSLGSPVISADREPPPAPSDPIRRELDAVRDQLVALDIEKALASLASILERPGLPDVTRVEALDLRAQAHAAGDELDAVEQDYRAILELQPGYAPDPQLTSKKAMDRFAKTKAATIGTVRLDVDPADASVTIDDRPIAPQAGSNFAAAAGDHRVTLTRKGFDTQEATAHVVAGDETLLKVRLVPNARTLVVRTDVPGVAVTLDGAARGLTTRPTEEGTPPEAPPTLTLDDASVGDHQLVLTKSCYATEEIQQQVSVDLVDRSPKILPVVSMRPARTRVTAAGAGYEGELRVDGERAAALPLTSFSLCPGRRLLEVSASGRAVWSETIVAEETDLELDLTPRPSAVLVGSAWPKAWEPVASRWSEKARLDLPASVDLTTRSGWSGLALPAGTDLAVAVLPGAAGPGSERTVLYSPLLKEVEERETPPDVARPVWNGGVLGLVAVDDGAGGVVIARVVPGGPAAKVGILPGDGLVSIGGTRVADAAAAKHALSDMKADMAYSLEIASPSQPPRTIECRAAAEPRLGGSAGDSWIVIAAWASVDAAVGHETPLALANLAELLDRSGQTASAVEVWRRVRATADAALSARAAYALGVALQSAGKKAEAIEAFNQAKAEGMARSDRALTAAAIDHLADLGVAAR